MSHLSKVSKSGVTQPQSIAAAVEILKGEGAEIELLTDAVPRLYNRQQERDVGVCDFVIKLNSERYDVGFKWVDEENSFDLYYDTYTGGLARQLGINDRKDIPYELQDQMCLAKFMEAYNGHLMMEDVRKQEGFISIDYSYNDNGMQLVAEFEDKQELAYA